LFQPISRGERTHLPFKTVVGMLTCDRMFGIALGEPWMTDEQCEDLVGGANVDNARFETFMDFRDLVAIRDLTLWKPQYWRKLKEFYNHIELINEEKWRRLRPHVANMRNEHAESFYQLACQLANQECLAWLKEMYPGGVPDEVLLKVREASERSRSYRSDEGALVLLETLVLLEDWPAIRENVRTRFSENTRTRAAYVNALYEAGEAMPKQEEAETSGLNLAPEHNPQDAEGGAPHLPGKK
jgi:hypothetical protein